MTRKIILSLFVLGLINISALAKEPISPEKAIKLNENTIDFTFENVTQEPVILEFDSDKTALPEISKSLEQKADEIEEIKETKEVLEEQLEQKAEEIKETKEEIEEQAEQKINQTKRIIKEQPVIQLRGLSSSSTVDSTIDSPQNTGEIRLETPNTTVTSTSKAFFEAPKWEEFCETGYENATKKEKENILNIINVINAERTKNNYWAERRESFEKAIKHCNSLENNAQDFCYQDVRNAEIEKNEFYEQQRKNVNYKNQGIRVDK